MTNGSAEEAAVRVAAYVRVSTRHQAEDGFSLADQKAKLAAHCQARGWDFRLFEDAGLSGERLEARPAMQRLLLAVDQGEVDVVLVVDDSRLARDELVGALVRDRLKRARVKLVTLSGDRDLNDPSDNFVASVLSAAAAFEQDLRTQKTADGLRSAVEAGFWAGGPPPFGLRLVPEGRHTRLVVDDEEATTLRLAASLLVDHGLSTWEAAARLNALGRLPRRAARWEHIRLRRALQAPYLGGRWTYAKPGRYNRSGGAPLTVAIPAVFDPERHAALRAALASTGTGPYTRDQVYPLSGHLFGLCGGRYHGLYRRDRDLRQYRCTNVRPERAEQGLPRCADRRFGADALESVVWGVVCDLLAEPERLLRMASDFLGLRAGQVEVEREQLGEVERRIARLERAVASAYAEGFKAGLDPVALRAACRQLEEERDALGRHLAQLRAWKAENEVGSERTRQLWTLAELAHRNLLHEMVPRQKAVVLDLLQVRVTVLEHATRTSPSRVRIEGTVVGQPLIDRIQGGDGYPTNVGLRRSTCCRP